ncbi:MAG TPA: S8 family serine peptidase [Blastocatellia bacterium]|nr:S8 family serine peptidase [Blastocatellia bacterium]
MGKRLIVALVFLIALIGSTQTSAYRGTQDRQVALSKIAPWVLERTAGGQQAEYLVVLREQADLSGAQALKSRQEKGRFVYQTLYKKAQQTQGAILGWLRSQGIEHRSYYIVNMVWVRGTLDTALALAGREEVARIEGNPQVRNNLPEVDPLADRSDQPLAVEPNITYTRAPEVWAMGYTGQGIVVAGADTGIRWDHDALKNKYRGFNGVTADHNFNWHDSIHSGGGSCGADTSAPCDDHGHGTHTLGTAVGDDGAANQIGMAPGAKWIGCRNMNVGNGTPATYIECMEFFLAPYPIGGTPAQGNPDLAPDVTVNSWGCPPSEGCMPDTLKAAVEAQRAAGIMMVVSAGNSGSGCSTVHDPPAIYDASYSVGAISHATGNIASFSSRGPVTIDGSGRMKPDITAPGVSVRSSLRNTASSYGSLSGTSMAGPHVAGAVALMWSAQPAIKNHIGFTENLLNIAAVDVDSAACDMGGVPNNVYGHGRLDVKAAVDLALPCTSVPSISKTSKSYPAAAAVDTVNVTAAPGCSWTAEIDVPGFISILSGSSGSGNGTVTFSIAENVTASPRSATITIAGQSFTVLQGAAFNDVPEGHLFYNDIGKLSARGITAGCGGANYCPEASVTRQEMAAFIIKSLGQLNPPQPSMQRFLDVPPQNPFYAFIGELAVRQITFGCGGGNYCPTEPVLRDQMAAFILKALGEFNPPEPPFQRFLDVPPTSLFYRFIDRLAVLQITAGCGGGNYCPSQPVTRAEMAAFLVRAFDL